MAQQLTLSIVTPSFNTGKYLAAAIESVLNQNVPGVDYIVMDGGSTDSTLDVLKSFGSRLQWVSEKDGGQSDAVNKGFVRTKGDVLTWLNADDTFADGAVKAAMDFLESHPDVAMVYGNADYIDVEGRVIGACTHIEPYNFHRLLHYSCYIVQPAAFFRRSAFEAVGGLDASLNWVMDYDLWLKIARKFKVAYLPKLLAHYRWLGNNKTATGGFARLDEISRIISRQGAGTPAYVCLERVNLHLQQSIHSLRERRMGSAISSLISATGNLLSSPRAMLSMCQPNTWRIIHTGQILRARAVRKT